MPIRILIVDDHLIVREGLALIVQREDDMEVSGFAANGEEAVATFRADPADIVLMDLQLPVMTGVQAIREIRTFAPAAAIIVLTMYKGDEDIHRALEAGAATYLLKDSLSDDLIRVIREVHAGGRPMSPDVEASLKMRAERQQLTPREIKVLELVFEGQRNKEIAASLSIREETVEVHLKNVYTKLDVHDRTAAVRVALSRGILHVA